MEFVADQLSFVGGLRVRAMFGGYGVYQDDHIFAIIVDDRLYFKADPVTRSEHERQGLRPFTYIARGKPVSIPYFEAPPEVFEDEDVMRNWVRKALQAAISTRKAKSAKPAPRRTGKKPRAAKP